MIDQRWSTIDGKSWILGIDDEDEKASVVLMSDEKTYLATVWRNEDSCWQETCDCLKVAKKVCMDEIAERLYQEDIS